MRKPHARPVTQTAQSGKTPKAATPSVLAPILLWVRAIGSRKAIVQLQSTTPRPSDLARPATSEPTPPETDALHAPAPAKYTPHRIPLPAAVRAGEAEVGGIKGKIRLRWTYAISIVVLHAIALLATLPYFFSWSGLILCLLGLYIFGTLGVNLGFHRLLTHRSFKCPQWVERTVAILGVCCLQEGPARWVAIHRKHHQDADEQPDPHSPLVTFLWGHVGWLIVENLDTDSFHLLQRYSRDLASQPFYLSLEKKLRWLWVYIAHAVIIAAAAFAIGWAITPNLAAAVQFTASIVLWGVVLRTVLVWHITWSVNSLSHLWGYQSFQTGENSRNNWFVALISNGEGWHNNHHGDQRSAAHGHKWYEFDVTYLTIRAMQMVGLATNVMVPDRHHKHPHAHE